MSATGAIARLHVQVWFNGVARALDSRRAAYSIVGAVGIILIAWLVYGTISFSSQLGATPESVQYLVEPLTATMVQLSAMAALFVAVYSISDPVVNNLLAVMPIDPEGRSFATRWLATMLSFVFGAVWSFPLIFQYVRVLSVAKMAVVFVSCLLLLLVGALTAQVMASTFGYALSAIVRSPKVINAISSAGAALLLTWAFLAAIPVGRKQVGEGPIAQLAVPLFWAIRNSVPYVLMIPGYLGVAVMLILLLRLLDRLPPVRPARIFTLSSSLRLGGARTLAGLETRQWVRFPANGVFLLFLAIVAGVVIALWGRTLDESKWAPLGYLFLALVSTLGVGAYGSTRQFHWLYPTTGRPLAWVTPKLLGTLLLWLASVTALVCALLVFTTWNFSDGWTALPVLLLELLVGSIVGLLLPVSQEQSLGSALSETVAVTLVFSFAAGIESVTWPDSRLVTSGLYFSGFGALLATYWLFARHISRSGLTS